MVTRLGSEQFDVAQTNTRDSPYGDPPEGLEGLKKLALEVVKDDIEVSKRANSAEEGTRTRLYELYRAKYDASGEDNGRSRINSSDVMDTIEWMMPSFVKAFCGGRSAIEVAPQGTEDVGKAKKNQQLLNWQFMNRCRGFLTLYEWIKAGLVYGTSYVKVSWREDYVRKGFSEPEVLEPQMQEMLQDDSYETVTAGSIEEVMVPPVQQPQYGVMSSPLGMPGMPGMGMNPNAMGYGLPPAAIETMRVYRDVRGERRITTYSGPNVDVIPAEDFFMDPEAKSMDDARFVIHRVKRTISYLRKKEREGIYGGVEDVVRAASSPRDSSEESSRYATAGDTTLSSSGDGREQKQVARRKVDVWEWWGLLDTKGDGIAEPYVVTMAADVILRLERNPYAHGLPPFVELRPILDLFRFHGIGIAELVGEFQMVKTAIWRQCLDNLSFQNNQMWEVDENAGVDLHGLLHPRPGGIVFTNMLNKGFRQITPAPLGAAPLQMMEFVQGALEQRSGVTRYNQGLDARTLNHTATGISAILGASQQRIDLIARILSESIRRLYKMMLELNQQFIDQTMVVRIFNSPLEISPDDLAGNFDVTVDIGGATGKEETEVQQILSILQQAKMLMAIGVMRPENIYYAVQKIMEIWGWKDWGQYLSDPQETQAMKAIMAQIAQMGQAVQQGVVLPPQAIAQLLQQIYQVLAAIVGASAGQEGESAHGNENPGQQERSSGGPAVTGVLDPHAGAQRGSGSVSRADRYGGAV